MVTRIGRWGYAGLLLGVSLFLLCKLFHLSQWLQTDLTALLPTQHAWQSVQQWVDKRQEQQLNHQMVALVGHQEFDKARQLAQQIAEQWQQSAQFAHIDSQTTPDLNALQRQVQQLKFATLPSDVRQQLLTDPKSYFQHYAEQFFDPFASRNLLPLEQDWLGFGRFVLSQSQPVSQLEWDSQSGMIYLQKDGQFWVLLRGVLGENPAHLLTLIAQNQHTAAAMKGQFLVASTALFAEQAKQHAEQESQWMAVLGISVTLLLLLGVFRSWRVVWLFLPIFVGMIAGVSATLLWFEQVHILTLVIGTSLVGVLIDFPLHWLSGSLNNPSWHAQRAMQQLKKTFLISLSVTVLGYLLLGFTPLPVLQQTALFSAVALVASISFTLLYLPWLFRHFQRHSNDCAVRFFAKICPNLTTCRLPKWLAVALVGLTLFGIGRSQWQDDIRQWVNLPPDLTAQLQRISELTQLDFGSQYFLIQAENTEQLLEKSHTLTKKLELAQQQGKLSGIQSLNYWLMSQAEQRAFAEQLATTISEQDYEILAELGFSLETLRQAINALPTQATVSLEQALQTQLGQGWQSLYLGERSLNQVVGLVKVSGVSNGAEIQALANQRDIFWQDKRADLNQSFQHTRNQAAWLKLFSFLIAGLLLWRIFGWRASGKMLTVPLLAIAGVIAIFGYAGIPIGLFTMFGLLLVSAIGIDYTAFMHSSPEPFSTKQRAVGLAGLTTVISFVLLSLSHTPAVSQFGLSVSLGVVLSVLLTLKFK